AARKAAFSMIPSGDIGGYTDLVRFLDDVRVVLGLPPKARAASTATEDFEKVLNIIRSARYNIDQLITNLSLKPILTFAFDRLKDAETELTALQSKYKSASPGSSGEDDYATALTFPEVETLFHRLSDMLKERYRFDIFAPGSINYGLLLNY